MKKLFFGLATLLFFCFVTTDVSAQVDTLKRNNGNIGQLRADTSKKDTSNMVKPVPNNPTDRNVPDGVTPGLDTPPSTPNRPNSRPEPLPPNVPDSPMPNIPNPPPIPTTGAPIG